MIQMTRLHLFEFSISEVDGLTQAGIIAGGMLPKVQCCVESVQGGVGRTHIIDGRQSHSMLPGDIHCQGIDHGSK